MKRILLQGRNHVELGEAAIEQIGCIAVALGRGRHPKAYPYVEPNEDSLIVATDGEFHLMAVADGHNGTEASHTAAEAIFQTVPQLAEQSAAAAVSSACSVAQEALRSLRPPLDPPVPATTLTVAAITVGSGAAGGWGDSVAIHLGRRRPRLLTARQPFFHAVGASPFPLSPVVEFRVREGDRVMLATDGLVDFVPRPWEQSLHALTADVASVEDGVRAAVDAAGNGGGGDNLAICLLQIP